MSLLRVWAVAALLAATAVGCGVLGAPRYQAVAYYDFSTGSPDTRYDFGKYAIGRWSGQLPVTRRLLIQREDNRLEECEFHAWIQPPPQLIARFLNAVGSGGGDGPEISGDIWRFELDGPRRLAWLGIGCKIGDQPRFTRLYRAEWRGDSPGDAAAAMADCVRQFAAELSRQIRK